MANGGVRLVTCDSNAAEYMQCEGADIMNAMVIGAGGAGRIHAHELSSRGIEVAVHDVDMARAATLAKEVGVGVEADAGADGYDLAVVAVPACAHREVAEAQVDRGRIVVCEKPLALYPEDAEALTELDGLYIAESQCYAGDDSLHIARQAQAIQHPTIWQVVASTTYRPQAWYDKLHIGGGTFLEGGAHILTTARVLFGEAVSWQGAVRCFAGGDGPDSGTFLIEYERGDILSLSIYWGTEGCFTGACDPIGGVGGLIDAQEARSWWPADNHSAMWDHLLKCISGEAEPVATLHHAAGAVADAWRCYEAAGVSR